MAAPPRSSKSLRAGGKVLLFGNGGSAADAQHISAELVGRFTVDRRPLAAIALTVDTSAITAIANDYGFEHVFDRQLRALGRPGDVALAITTSGKSESILRAVRSAKEIGMKVIGLTGGAGREFAADVRRRRRRSDARDRAHPGAAHHGRPPDLRDRRGRALRDRRRRRSPSGPAPRARRSRSSFPVREHYRKQGRTVVWTNGCFDILHVGHVESLKAARRLGDILVVGVNDDAHVKRAKGADRPIHDLAQRIAILSALEVVDHVVPFSEATPRACSAASSPTSTARAPTTRRRTARPSPRPTSSAPTAVASSSCRWSTASRRRRSPRLASSAGRA